MIHLRRPVDYFSEESLRDGLKQKTVRGGVVTASAQFAILVITLATIPALSRLLDPEDFGLVAMVAVVTNFASMFVDAGLSMATVQRERITRQQVSNLFWIATGLGSLIALVVACLSPAVAWFFGEPRLIPITIALAVSFLFSGLTVQHQALLQRGMQFGSLSAVRIVSAVLGQTVGIAWAWKYFGTTHDYWALVLIPITMAMVGMVGTWLVCPWRPGRPVAGVGTRSLVVFGANLTGFTFANYFARNADKLLIGWWWGATPLGFYERAYRLLLMPMQQIAPAFTAVVLPALSRLRSSPEKFRHAYRTAMRPLVWLSIPAVGLLFATSEPLILLYMGPKWGAVVPLFRALVPAAWANCFINGSGWVFSSMGHVDKQFRWGIIHAGAVVATIAACMPYGPLSVAYGVSIVYVVMRLPGFYLAFQGTQLRLRDLGDLIWRPTLLAGIASGVSFWAGICWFSGFSLAGNLVSVTGIYGVVFIVGLFLLPGTLGELRHLRSITSLASK